MTAALLSKRLKKLLATSAISESELARRVEIPRATINRLVAGKMPNPKMHMLKSLASYFDLSVDYLLQVQSPRNSGVAVCKLPLVPWQDLHCCSGERHYPGQEWAGATPPKDSFLTIPTEKRSHYFPNHKQQLLITPNAKPRPGQLVVLHLYKGNSNQVRQMFLMHQQFKFKNPNSQLHEWLDQDDFSFIGVVHQLLQLS